MTSKSINGAQGNPKIDDNICHIDPSFSPWAKSLHVFFLSFLFLTFLTFFLSSNQTKITRSIPGVTTALVGMKSKEHTEENLKLVLVDPVPARDVPSCLLGSKRGGNIPSDDLMREE